LTITNKGINMNKQFLKYVQKVWNKSDEYVIGYLKAANKVKHCDDLVFLIELRMIVKSL